MWWGGGGAVWGEGVGGQLLRTAHHTINISLKNTAGRLPESSRNSFVDLGSKKSKED